MEEIVPLSQGGGSGVQKTKHLGITEATVPQPFLKVCATVVASTSDHTL